MDKKSIIIIVILAAAIIFYWPILEFLGLSKPVDYAPEFTPIGQQATAAGSNLLFTLQAVDRDRTIPILSSGALPANAGFADHGDGSGLFSWTPSVDQAGSYSVTFYASDDSLSDTLTIGITVYEQGAQPPPLSGQLTDLGGPTDQNAANAPALDSLPIDSLVIRTDKYTAILSTLGGGPISLQLNDYALRDGRPVEMLPFATSATPELVFAGGTFSTSSLHFVCNLPPGEYRSDGSPLDVIYTYAGPNGGLIERKYTFFPDRHHYDLMVRVDQPAKFGFDRLYQLNWNTPLGATEPDLQDDYSNVNAVAMVGDSREQLDDFNDNQLKQGFTGDVTWGGVRSKYFSAVMIPRSRRAQGVSAAGTKEEISTFEVSYEKRDLTVALDMEFTSISPIADSFTVFVGPMDYSMMAEYDVGIEDMLDIGTTPVIGWLIKPFAIGIMWVLPKLYTAIPNYGLVIILFALLVKLITLPLSLKSYKSMNAMKMLQPNIDALKTKHKKDPQKLNKEMMGLYKKHGVNPMSGCLPILPQMPLFFALFSVFRSTILLRNAPFFWFMDDLSRGAQSLTDPYMILVVIMVVAQFISQKFTMAQSQQNKALGYVMPLFFGFMFYKFAAGLVLYWTAFSLLSLVDFFIFRRKSQGPVVTT